MTVQLRVALYVEGTTDQHFLPALIRRTLERLIRKHGQTEVIILEPEVINPTDRSSGDHAEYIYQVAQKAADYDILVIHSDVDKRSPQEAYAQSIERGLIKVEQARNSSQIKLCKHLVPLLPTRMIEAWILVDHKALCNAIGTDKSATELQLPKVNEVERIANPKEILTNAVKISLADRSRRRRRQAEVSEIVGKTYSQMGEQVDLTLLDRLPSYQNFESKVADSLSSLGLIKQ